VLYHTRSPNLRKYSQVDFDGYCGEKVVVLETLDSQVLLQDLIPYILQTEHHFKYALRTASGSTNKFTSWKKIAAYEFLLPPLEQQQELVELMRGFEASIEAGEETVDAYKSLLNIVTEVIFSDTSNMQSCDDLCSEITVGVVVKPASYYVTDGVPALRSLNILSNKLNLDDLVYFSEDSNALLSKTRLRDGDVLVVRSGTPGTACAVPPSAIGFNCIDLIIIRPKKQLVLSKYLAFYLNSFQGKRQLSRRSGGLAQQHVNVGAIRTVEVPIISANQQNLAIEKISTCILQIEEAVQHVDTTKNLRSSVLNSILTPSILTTPLVSA